MTEGRKPRTLEARRSAGEVLTVLPVIVGGRPSETEMERPPASLDRWGKAAWREVVPLLVHAKLIDKVDRQAVEAYALHMGRARALRETIEWVHWDDCECPQEDGEEPHHVPGCRLGRRRRGRSLEEQFMARTQRGYTSNPLLSQEREALREARMMGELLGLNPVGRTRMTGAKKKPNGLGALVDSLPVPQLRAVPADE
jgi:P27 family predicted phage terminase small subunit